MSNEEIIDEGAENNNNNDTGKGFMSQINEKFKSITEKAQDKVQSIGNNINEASEKAEAQANKLKSATFEKVDNLSESAAKGLKFESVEDAKNKTSMGFKQFTSGFKMPSSFTNSSLVGATKSFMNSNSLISRFVFILLLLIVSILVLRVLIVLLTKLLMPSKNPILLDGMIDARKPMTINVDPNMEKSKPIYRSTNENQGVEFTWNLWVFIDDIYYESDHYRHIFHKGDSNFTTSLDKENGISHPNNAPGMYIAPGQEHGNRFVIMFNTYEHILERVEIDDIPIEKWICVTIRCQNKTIDVYINGVLTKRHTLKGAPKQNYGNVYITQNRGFGGYLSELRYFNHAINYNKIKEIKDKGPNLNMIGGGIKNFPPYLRTQWFYSNKEYS
jgi:hypothetical protein|tara:strand:+ start:1338 stop:2501 length:1164 start_codon:yes stop_codon:yes gene_type:complete